jgi:hypothetical protein
MKKCFVIWHTDLNKPESRRVVGVATSFQAKEKYFEAYKRAKAIAVQKAWYQSPQNIINEYLPNFIENVPGHFTSVQTWESLEFEMHDMIDDI